MRKYLKPFLVILGVLLLGVAVCIPNIGKASDASQKSVYEPVKTSDLFYAYPYHLKVKNQSQAVGMEYFSDYKLINAHENALDGIYSLSSGDEAMMTVITSLKNGVDYTLSELGSLLGLTSNFEQRAADRATKQLLEATMSNKGLMMAISEECEEISEAWENLREGQDFFVDGTYALLSDTQKKAIKSAIDERADVLDAIDVALTSVEVGGYVCFMEQVDEAVLNYLITNTYNSTLSSSLQRYRSAKNTNYQSYIIDKYLSEGTITVMEHVIQEGLNSVGTSASAIYTVVDAICEATGSGLSWITGLGTNEDLMVSMLLESYASEFISRRTELINEFLTQPFLSQKVTEYKKAYILYTISVRALVESVKDVNASYENLMNSAVKNIDMYVSYENHIEGCKVAVENLPMEERRIVKGNPELYYSIYSDDFKISDASDVMEDNTIYFANGKLNYGLHMEYSENVQFSHTSDKTVRVINGDLFLKKSEVTVPENLELNITGDLNLESPSSGEVGYDWNYSLIYLEGTLKTNGNVYGTGNKALITMQGEAPLLELVGDVYCQTYFRVYSGNIIFRGSNVFAYPSLWSSEGANIQLETDGKGTIELGSFRLEQGMEPISINAYHYYNGKVQLTGTALGHAMIAGEEILIPRKFEVGSITVGKINIDGTMIVEDDFRVHYSDSDNVNISGNLMVGGDYIVEYGSNNCLNLSGTLKVDGDFSAGNYNYTEVIMQNEAALLEVDGNLIINEETEQKWSVSNGRLIFGGSKIHAPTLYRIHDAKIEIRTDGTGEIDLGIVDFSAGTKPINIDIIEKEGEFIIDGEASGHTMSADPEEVYYRDETGGYVSSVQNIVIKIVDELLVENIEFTNMQVNIDGVLTVENDCFITGGTSIFGSCLTVDGTLTVNNDCNLECYNLFINNTLIVNNDCQIKTVYANTGGSEGCIKGNLIVKNDFSITETAIKLEIEGNVSVGGDCSFGTEDCDADIFFGGILTVMGDFKKHYNASIYIQGDAPVLEVKGNMVGGVAEFFSQNADEILTIMLSGEECQTVDGISGCATLVLNNTSEEGVIFMGNVNLYELFNHNGCKFTLFNEGKDSSFVDYDGDGITDEKDAYPTDATLPVRKVLIEDMIELEKYEYIYTGTEHRPQVVVKDGKKILEEHVDYELDYQCNIGGGTALVAVTGLVNYCGTATKAFEIRRATPEITVTDTWTYTTDTKEFVLDAVLTRGEGELLYASSNPKVVEVNQQGIVSIKGEGQAYIIVSVAETLNYQMSEKVITVTVEGRKEIVGDVDGNGVVNSNDAIYLLYHVMVPDKYEVNQDCDFDCNGVINSNDSIYLLYHTLLPNQYPLHK